MNVKNVFSMIGDVLSGIAGILGSLVSVAVLSMIVFGSGWMGIDVVGNISALVASFGTGVTGLLVLIILLSLWDNK